MSEKLKPCPFCGSCDDLQFLDDNDYETVQVNCLECGTCGPEADTRREALDLWNRRAEVKDDA